MNYVGVDLHKVQSWFYTMDENGKRMASKSISNEIAILKEYFESIPKPFTLAVEATYNWYFFVDLAEIYADKVYLANSYELKAFAKRNKKTDKIDAKLIADILRKGYLPAVHISDKKTRALKESLRYRLNLIKDRSKAIFRLKALLDKLGLQATGDFTTDKALGNIHFTAIPKVYHPVVKKYIEQLKWYREKIYEYRKNLEKRLVTDQDIINLISIPGISFFSAALIKTEIADISRFKNFNCLCSYAGLAPRVHQSANTSRNGPLSKNRCKNLQWILIENAIHFIHAMPHIAEKHEQIKKRKGYNTAKVSTARDMLKAVYHVLKEQRPFFINKV
ncbi:MAG: IS110 family transposase [candidate division Zixibacteria bacterium]|nr:IS110 family transposase [candidate division Zixibacteria bacterium]